MGERHEIWKVADGIQQDLRAAQGKLVELRRQLSDLALVDGHPRCPVCGYQSAMNLPSVAEHIETRHPELTATLR